MAGAIPIVLAVLLLALAAIAIVYVRAQVLVTREPTATHETERRRRSTL
jgi:hypothetical protein